MATSPDGTLVAKVNGNDFTAISMRSREYALDAVVILEAASGRVIHTLTGHSAEVASMTFSPDGRRLATASYDRTIKLWDLTTGREVFTLLGHTAGLVCFTLSPDGNRIISGSYDATARVWDATPLPSDVIAEHDTRYRRKLETLHQLKAMTNDALRADILAQRGEWALAAHALREAIKAKPENIRHHLHLCLSLLQIGNNQAYRQAAQDLFAAFGKSYDFQANNVAWCYVLGPDAVDDTDIPVRLAESAVAAHFDAEKAGFLNTLGTALYRAGRYGEAITRLNESVQAGGGVGVPQDWAFLAMAHIGRGDVEAAHGWLQKLRSYKPGESSAFDWNDVEIRCLRNEVEALMLKSSSKRPEVPSAPESRSGAQQTGR